MHCPFNFDNIYVKGNIRVPKRTPVVGLGSIQIIQDVGQRNEIGRISSH